MSSRELADMWEADYGKEPFDLRLTVLRMMRQWKTILMCTFAGTLLFGGVYCVKNVFLRGEKQYQVQSVYRVEYAVEDQDLDKAYINDYTWNTYVHTEEFLNNVQSYMENTEWSSMSNDELETAVKGGIESDWRVPYTTVITENPDKTVAVAFAVEETMTRDFPEGISEINTIRVMDSPKEAKEVIPDVRVGRAFVLGAVLSFFFTMIILLLKEIGDDSIWLPATIKRRYGLKVVGTMESRELAQNVNYFFTEKGSISVCTVQENANPIEVAEALEKKCGSREEDRKRFVPVPAPALCPESAEVLRKAEGVLLVLTAGKHAGKQLEYVLEYLAGQACKVTAVLLWNADERLIRSYYRFEGQR